MSLLGLLHLVAAFAAITSGALVLLLPGKGGRRHRLLGWTWVASMLVLNATALAIYRLFGGFGPFHAMALASLLGVLAGVLSGSRARRSRLQRTPADRSTWVARHYYWMTFSYAGLIAAFASETITRLPATRPAGGPGVSFALAVGGATCLVTVVAARWIRRSASRVLAGVHGRR